MKRGRPKSLKLAKNRMHSVILTDKAEIIYREVCKSKGDSKWFHIFVSEHIIDAFNSNEEALIMREILVIKKQQQELGDKMYELTRRLSVVRNKKEGGNFKKEISKLGVMPEV